MDKSLLFIFNAYAGKSRIKPKLADIIDMFVKEGYLVTAYPTQSNMDAKKMVEQCAGEYDLVVCSGGDGTLNEIVTGMMHSERKVPIGYIPTGTTNDFARSVGIPRGLMNAAQAAVTGNKFQTDIGLFNDRNFVYIAAFGVFTDVSYQTKQEMKNVIGHTAYILEGMKRLASIKPYHMRVWIDDYYIEDNFIYGMVSNSMSIGGFKNLTGSEVVLDDGLFEVVLVREPQNPLEFQEMLSAILLESVESDFVCEYKARRITVQADEAVAWTLDGEYGGDHIEAVIKNQEQALQIMVDNNQLLNTKNRIFIPVFDREK